MKRFSFLFTPKNIVLLVIVVAIFCVEQHNFWVEKYYYGFLYPITSYLQRAIFSRVSFSVGDIFYIFIAIYIGYRVYQFIKNIIGSNNKFEVCKQALLNILQFVIIIYIVFKLLWGLNYSRMGVAHQFKLEKYHYTITELNELIDDLVFEANNNRKQIKDTSLPNINIDSVFIETKKSYQSIAVYYPFLNVKQFTIKPSLFSKAGNYFGYTGYYNPFTGEAQVRSDIPAILLPFICCHEVAHQIGYASEEEANFIGCIVANHSTNMYFKYSMNLELLDNALKELMMKYFETGDVDGFIANQYKIKDCMSVQVKKDRKNIRLFFEKNRKETANISNYFYDKYLKINNQTNGIKSYNEVIGWVLSYRKKYSGL